MPICHIREHGGYEVEIILYPPGDPRGPYLAGVPELGWTCTGFETLEAAERAAMEVINSAENLRCERRAGELLAETPLRTNQHSAGDNASPALADLGITKKQSSRWQQVAKDAEP